MRPEIHLQLVAILLRRGATLDYFSSALTLLGLGVGIAPLLGTPFNALVSTLAISILVLGIVEKYWAQRVAIDAELFNVLATRSNDLDAAIKQLDTALHELGLMPAVTTPRSLTERSRGALRLLRFQIIFLATQCLLAVIACAAVWQ